MAENGDVVTSSRPRWQTLIRQNSEKIETFAEVAVLPKNQRSIQTSSTLDEVTVRDVESQGAFIPTLRVNNAPQIKKKYFPIFMLTISFIEILLMHYAYDDHLLLIFAYDPHRRHEIWRFVTVMLVHSGLLHLWTNVVFQLILGVLLEIVHNWKRIAIIYIASIVGGTLFISILTPRKYAVGASGGVYGLLFSHLATIIINWKEMDRKRCRVFWLLAYIVFDIGFSLFLEIVVKRESNTSHFGHVGGGITGFLVSIFVLKNFVKRPWEEKMQKICIGVMIAICTIIVLVNVFAWGHYLPTEWNFNYTSTYSNYIVKLVIESPKLSQIRKSCEDDVACKKLIDVYMFNGTIDSSLATMILT